MPCFDSDTAYRYSLGQLTPEQRQEIDAHVLECQECALKLRQAQEFIEAHREKDSE